MANLTLFGTALLLLNSLMIVSDSHSDPDHQNQVTEKHSVFISKATFKDSKFNNSHAGSAFFLEYQDKIYGVTAKHVLLFAKTENMSGVDFSDELISWEFVSPAVTNLTIEAGKLINTNPDEAIAFPFIGDWLIFEIDAPLPPSIHVFALRDTDLNQGEAITFKGFPYNFESTTPISIEGSFDKVLNEHSFSMNVPRGNYGGCSGGPVLDQNNNVVGLVSMGYFDEANSRMVFEPASINYFKQIIDSKNQAR